MRNWCNAELLPYPTLAIALTVDTSDFPTLKTVPVEAILTKFVCNLAELTEASGWPDDLNVWVPIPEAVVPNPTIFVLTVTLLGSVFV